MKNEGKNIAVYIEGAEEELRYLIDSFDIADCFLHSKGDLINPPYPAKYHIDTLICLFEATSISSLKKVIVLLNQIDLNMFHGKIIIKVSPYIVIKDKITRVDFRLDSEQFDVLIRLDVKVIFNVVHYSDNPVVSGKEDESQFLAYEETNGEFGGSKLREIEEELSYILLSSALNLNSNYKKIVLTWRTGTDEIQYSNKLKIDKDSFILLSKICSIFELTYIIENCQTSF